ncbi:Outer membrane protein [Vibrio chagasii]|nr:Outer membrane protein [Vibrio chagasii]CAH6883124.1 Outer membrane protein [Vibrio chagasii]CAH6885501.1 Outer membrane protein [Vibrio chagasii]CAH7194603.1 Outer membrane protein [Vibrio chagasii]CAH7231644.1 Outer membrane protein [Vibrio chagasii]
MNKSLLSAVLLLSSFTIPTALAAVTDSGFYLGGAIGSSDIDDDGLVSKSNSAQTATFEAKDNAYRIMAGYKFNRIASIEVQYTDYGDVVAHNAKVNFARSYNFSWAPKVISLSANLGYTFDNGLRPFGVVGLSSIDLDSKEGRYSLSQLKSDADTGARVGFGLEYTPPKAPAFTMRLGYEADAFDAEINEARLGTNKTYKKTVILDSFYLGAMYTF